MNSREISKLAMVYIEIDQDIKEETSRRRAVIAIQSTWRGVLIRRKTKIMLNGFTELQKLYRQKLQVCISMKP